MPDTDAPALPVQTLPPAPVSPDVELPDTASDLGLRRVLEAFRTLQLQHTRTLAHESAVRDLNVTDTRLLLHLAGADGQGVTPKQAGDHLELSTGAMTSLLDRLERRGYVERRPNPGDRRSILVHLTPSGSEVAHAVGGVWADVFSRAVAPAERAGVADALERVGRALEQHVRSATSLV